VEEVVGTQTAGTRKPRTSSREETSKLIVFLLELHFFFSTDFKVHV
jgi:hypothetical protein